LSSSWRRRLAYTITHLPQLFPMASTDQHAVAATSPAGPTFPPGRYGRRRAAHGVAARRYQRGIIAALLCAVLAASGAAAWRLYQIYSAQVIHVRVLAFNVVSEHQVQVQFEVKKSPGSAVTCNVRARSRDGADVGQAEVVLPPHGPDTMTYSLMTRKRAVIGEVLRCVPGE